MGTVSPPKKSSQSNQLDLLTYLVAATDEIMILAQRAGQDVAAQYLKLAVAQLHQGLVEEKARIAIRRPPNPGAIS